MREFSIFGTQEWKDCWSRDIKGGATVVIRNDEYKIEKGVVYGFMDGYVLVDVGYTILQRKPMAVSVLGDENDTDND